jgi:hypothetical protein
LDARSVGAQALEPIGQALLEDRRHPRGECSRDTNTKSAPAS